jgi:hypothetical protein
VCVPQVTWAASPLTGTGTALVSTSGGSTAAQTVRVDGRSARTAPRGLAALRDTLVARTAARALKLATSIGTGATCAVRMVAQSRGLGAAERGTSLRDVSAHSVARCVPGRCVHLCVAGSCAWSCMALSGLLQLQGPAVVQQLHPCRGSIAHSLRARLRPCRSWRAPQGLRVVAMVRNRGRLRDPDNSPLRDGNRDALFGLLTKKAIRTLVYYLTETNQVCVAERCIATPRQSCLCAWVTAFVGGGEVLTRALWVGAEHGAVAGEPLPQGACPPWLRVWSSAGSEHRACVCRATIVEPHTGQRASRGAVRRRLPPLAALHGPSWPPWACV